MKIATRRIGTGSSEVRNLQLIPVKAGLKYYVLSNLLYTYPGRAKD